MGKLRTWVQLCFTALSNGYAAGFLQGTIYKGKLKSVCLPGLNCYSCPGALGSCPIGAFQAVLASRDYPWRQCDLTVKKVDSGLTVCMGLLLYPLTFHLTFSASASSFTKRLK